MKLISTKNMKHEEWLRYRKLGIGGSDAGAICGVNPYSSPISVYMEKTSKMMNTKDDNEAMRQGRDLEQYVAERFMEETGLRVKRLNAIFRHDDYDFMLANVDRAIIGENAGLECKTASAYSADKWKDGRIPQSYEIQCQHYMAVMGWDYMYIACAILGRDFLYRKIKRDDELIKVLIRIEEDFWVKCVQAGKMPQPDGSVAYDEALNQRFSLSKNESVALVGFDEELLRREKFIKEIERLEAEKNKIEQRIKLYMEDKEVALNEKYRVSWIYTETQRLDQKKLKEEAPEIYMKYVKSNRSRRFTIKAVV